jgi:Phage integrase family
MAAPPTGSASPPSRPAPRPARRPGQGILAERQTGGHRRDDPHRQEPVEAAQPGQHRPPASVPARAVSAVRSLTSSRTRRADRTWCPRSTTTSPKRRSRTARWRCQSIDRLTNRHTCPYPQDIDGLSHDSQPLGRLATLGPAAAGGVPATLHQLSHFHATELVNGGVSLSTIRKRLGHRNLQTSLRYAEQTDAVAAAELRAWRRDHKQQRHNDTEPTAETAHLTAHCPWGQLWDRKVPGRLAQRRPLGPVRPQGLRQSRGVVIASFLFDWARRRGGRGSGRGCGTSSRWPT